MSAEVIFYHVSRRLDPLNNRVIAPSFYEVPLRSARYSNGKRIEDAVYSEPGMKHNRTMNTPTGPIVTVLDKTSISFDMNGVLRVDSSEREKIQFLREHQHCRGSLANKKLNKPVHFYEYNPTREYEKEVNSVIHMAEVVAKVQSFDSKTALSAWAAQWGIQFTDGMNLQNCKQDIFLRIKQNPMKFKIAEKVKVADATTEIVNWEDAGLIKTWKGNAAKYRWKWATAYKPDKEDSIILEFERDQDEYEALVLYLRENPKVMEKIRTVYNKAFSIT